LDIGPNDRDIASEGANGCEEIPKQNEDTIRLDDKPSQGPTEENEKYTSHEGCCSFQLLPPGKEDERLLKADDQGEPNEEEDLRSLICVVPPSLFPYISHGEPSESQLVIWSGQS
jgi:hypothetical protein